ncbi:class I SAM-dependent methyltransferase [Haloarchaeobius amylolyticus]|uniref:Class I SAM-dependent methyltransferase n=1 Tax=Haloarchaeobius amylolyticus TaxID=1198296 RepID=A0ABD6BHN6_9EURY
MIGFTIGFGAILIGRQTTSRWLHHVAVAAGLTTAAITTYQSRTLFSPPPWVIREKKYAALATRLPLADATTVLDVGCGTGRSLVGIAPFVPETCSVIGLDVFDDRVILGNSPALAIRNGRAAGLDVTAVAGDATRLPIASDTQDVVTACRVLHDLPATDQPKALEELHRVCAPDGTLGVLELPLTPAATSADPESYWRQQLTDAGFAVKVCHQVDSPHRTDPYHVFIATPSAKAECGA